MFGEDKFVILTSYKMANSSQFWMGLLSVYYTVMSRDLSYSSCFWAPRACSKIFNVWTKYSWTPVKQKPDSDPLHNEGANDAKSLPAQFVIVIYRGKLETNKQKNVT